MTANNARKWLILSSLSISTGLLLFFLLAPALGYPLVFAQSLRILEIVLPVFLGYLGSATTFVFRFNSHGDISLVRAGASNLLGLLIRGPLIVFGVTFVALIVAFGLTNGATASPGAGISVDQLSEGVSVILGLLAVTTNIAVNHLFGGGENADSQVGGSHSLDPPSSGGRRSDAS